MTDWFCYVATAECGCVAGVHVDEPEHKKDTAKFTADMIRRGFVVARESGTAWRERQGLYCAAHPNGAWA